MTGTIIDELVVRLALDAAGYVKNAKVATKTNKDMRDDADKTAKDMEAKGKKAASFWTAQKVEMLGFLGVVAGGAAALATLTIKVDGTNAAIGRLSEVTGTTPALLSGLQNLAKQYGSTADAANAAVSSIYNGMAQFSTTGQGNSAISAMIHMGINPVGPDGKPLDTTKIVEQAGAWFKGHDMMQDIVLGGALGMSPDFVNALVQSKDIAKTVSSQSTVSNAAAKKAEDLVTTEAKLGTTIGQLDTDIADKLTPALTSLINILTAFAGWLHVVIPAIPTTPLAIVEDAVTGAGVIEGEALTAIGIDPSSVRNAFDVFDTRQVSDSQWAAQLKQESGGHQFGSSGPLTSSAGAVGIAQLMPSTAQGVASKHGILWDPKAFANDAGYNGMLGRFYMNDMLIKYGGNYSKALAAYNWGPDNLDADIAANGAGWKKGLPNETSGYLANLGGVSGLSPSVTAYINHLRPTSGGGAGKSIGPVTINISGAQNPMATGRAVKGALNTLATQAARGLA